MCSPPIQRRTRAGILSVIRAIVSLPECLAKWQQRQEKRGQAARNRRRDWCTWAALIWKGINYGLGGQKTAEPSWKFPFYRNLVLANKKIKGPLAKVSKNREISVIYRLRRPLFFLVWVAVPRPRHNFSHFKGFSTFLSIFLKSTVILESAPFKILLVFAPRAILYSLSLLGYCSTFQIPVSAILPYSSWSKFHLLTVQHPEQRSFKNSPYFSPSHCYISFSPHLSSTSSTARRQRLNLGQ